VGVGLASLWSTQYSSTAFLDCYINLPVGTFVAALLFPIYIPDRVVKEDKEPTLTQSLHKLDILGAALFASAIIMFLLALQ
jgi:hypothetical protein